MDLLPKFLRSIAQSEHAADLIEKIGEVLIDSQVGEGILKELPFIGIVQRLYKMGNDLSAYVFTKKIQAFLVEIESVPIPERIAFLEKHCSDESERTNVGETALMILDRLDLPEQAAMLGRSFSLLMKGEITKETFEIHCSIIRGLNPYLSRQLKQMYQFENAVVYDPPGASQLANYGLLDEMEPLRVKANSGKLVRSFVQNQFGRYFYKNIFVQNTKKMPSEEG
jgi:hypothetical protein